MRKAIAVILVVMASGAFMSAQREFRSFYDPPDLLKGTAAERRAYAAGVADALLFAADYSDNSLKTGQSVETSMRAVRIMAKCLTRDSSGVLEVKASELWAKHTGNESAAAVLAVPCMVEANQGGRQ